MRILVTIFALLLVALQYRLWVGDNSVREVVRLQDQIALQQQGNAELKQRNDLLRQEIDDLHNGLDAIEERARHELGMIRQGEQFYRVSRTEKPKG